jgi:hypothetical protein
MNFESIVFITTHLSGIRPRLSVDKDTGEFQDIFHHINGKMFNEVILTFNQFLLA